MRHQECVYKSFCTSWDTGFFAADRFSLWSHQAGKKAHLLLFPFIFWGNFSTSLKQVGG